MLCDHALHSICIFTRFHAFRCVFICWKLCAVRFGLGWTRDAISFSTSHVHAFFMHMYHFFSIFLCWVVIMFSVSLPLSLSLSLSLSRIVCAWHPSANLLRLGTLFVPGHLLLIPLLFMFGSVMRRSVRTSRRTSPNMVFIRNAMWFYRTFPILLYPLSFIVRDGNLYMRYPWDVPPWSYKSSTPICMVLIPLYLNLLRRCKVHVS